MNTQAANSVAGPLSKPPYSDGEFKQTDGGFEIEFRVRDPRHLRRWLAIILALPTFVALTMLHAIPHIDWGIWWVWPIALAVGAVGLCCVIGYIFIVLTFAFYNRIVWDGTALLFTTGYQGTKAGGHCFPADEIIGLRIFNTNETTSDTSLQRPLTELFVEKARVHLEVVTPDGVMIVLENWSCDELRWAVAMIAEHAQLPVLTDREKDDTPQAEEPVITRGGVLKPKERRLFYSVLGTVVVLTSTIGVYSGMQVMASQKWPTAQAEIIRLDKIEHDDSESITVTYRYTVNGREYESQNYSVGIGSVGLHDYYDKQKVGDRVPAYYDPQDPEHAALKRGWGDVLLWFIFPGLASVGIVVLMRMPKKENELALQEKYHLPQEKKS
ncbi:MAG: DUF3592 domain-containing protein [Planctomycetota bacterium]